MNIHDLRSAQLHFESQIKTVIRSRQELYDLRDTFSAYYTDYRIAQMPLEHYALGNDLPEHGYNFCYTLERKLDGLGRIRGSTAIKFGIYYGKTRSDSVYKYRFAQRFGSNKEEAFVNVKSQIRELIENGRLQNIEGIISNWLSPMFKGKILSTYFPDRYLNIFSDEHLEYFLVQLNLDTDQLIWSDAVIKREALVAFKNQDAVMKHWPLDIYMYFLYNVYPGRPLPPGEQPKETDPLAAYKTPNFPSVIYPSWIDLSILPPTVSNPKPPAKGASDNPDYEKEARQLKKLGDRGEKIVLDMERKRLRALGYPDLAKKVTKAKYDYLGYDIKSFETNGDPRYIEVKATRSKVGTANFFLSSNELDKAKKLSNYFIYMVYDIISQSPKIWIIANPFNPENKMVVKTPISYRVVINAK